MTTQTGKGLVCAVGLVVMSASPVGAQVTPASPLPTVEVEVELTTAQRVEQLGGYEKAALKKALAARKLELEAEPLGKQVRKVLVYNLDVFGDEEGFLQLFNYLHITTREYVIEREVLLRPGDAWDTTVAEETRRRLNDALFTQLTVVMPIKTDVPGKLDLLVVTRDVWSLRMNSDWTIQGAGFSLIPGFGGDLLALTLAPSENNFLGRRKQLSAVFRLNQGQMAFGPQYLDKNIAGTRLQLLGRFDTLFSRRRGDFEGTTSNFVLSYPLWSFAREWGAGVSFSHYDSITRVFRGLELERYDNPDTPEQEVVPLTYDDNFYSVDTSVTRSFGRDIKHNVTLGHDFRFRRPKVRDDFVFDEVTRDAFVRDRLPRSERSSAMSVSYQFFTTKFKRFLNIDRFDLPEDKQVGPNATASVSWARKEIGSERNFLLASAGAAWTQPIAEDGLARLSVGVGTRVQKIGGEYDRVDNDFSSTAVLVTPTFFGFGRLVAQAGYRRIWDNRNNALLRLGGTDGLRGYIVNAFAGRAQFLGNVELRTVPIKVLFSRVGAAVFYDVGHVADTAKELALVGDVGVGVRLMLPQLQSVVYRLDFAVATNDVDGAETSRLLFTVGQAF